MIINFSKAGLCLSNDDRLKDQIVDQDKRLAHSNSLLDQQFTSVITNNQMDTS